MKKTYVVTQVMYGQIYNQVITKSKKQAEQAHAQFSVAVESEIWAGREAKVTTTVKEAA